MTELKTFHPKSREEWRDWLSKNHEKENAIGMIRYKKHTGKPGILHGEALREAICFGWIDTTGKRLDDERQMIKFVKRNKNSRWSNATLGYAKELIKEGKMSSFGLKMYKEGLEKPVIDHGLPKNPDTPKDLNLELKKEENKMAREHFSKLAPSYRRIFIYWIETAKRKETRDKRIAETIKKMKEGKKSYLG